MKELATLGNPSIFWSFWGRMGSEREACLGAALRVHRTAFRLLEVGTAAAP